MAILRVFDYFERGGIELEFAGNEIVTNACLKGKSIDKFCFAYDRWNDEILFGKDAKKASPVWCVECAGESLECKGSVEGLFLYFVVKISAKDKLQLEQKSGKEITVKIPIDIDLSHNIYEEPLTIIEDSFGDSVTVLVEPNVDENLSEKDETKKKYKKSLKKHLETRFKGKLLAALLDRYRKEVFLVRLEKVKGEVTEESDEESGGMVLRAEFELKRLKIPLDAIYWASDIKGYIG